MADTFGWLVINASYEEPKNFFNCIEFWNGFWYTGWLLSSYFYFPVFVTEFTAFESYTYVQNHLLFGVLSFLRIDAFGAGRTVFDG